MSTTIETLLTLSLPAPKTKTVTIPRLVMPDGKPLTLELRQLTFNQVADLRAHNRDFAVHTVLAGVKAPNLREDVYKRQHLSCTVSPQTLWHLRRLARMSGYGDQLGRVVDKLTREKVLELKPKRGYCDECTGRF